MKSQPMSTEQTVEAVDSAFMLKIFYSFLLLAGFSVLINFGGKMLGRSIVMAGHTDDRSIVEVVIGNNVLAVPVNEIRVQQDRRSGVASRLDTYLRWPSLEGYTNETRDDFNHVDGSRNIIFASFREQMMSRDMSGRMAPIYNALIVKPGVPGPNGVMLYGFREKSGYMNEVLAVAERGGAEPFVARCLTGESGKTSLAACERDIHIGDDLSMTYRFPDRLLADWRALDASMSAYARKRLKTIR